MADTVMQNDDNLSTGITYTFTFELANWFSMPSIATILADIQAQAPSFIGSVTASWAAGIGLLTNYLNVTFNYTGDGSDVVSDVANELIAVFQQVSGDSFTFSQATSGTAGITTLSSVTSAATQVGSSVGTAVGSVAGSAVQQASASVFSNLGTSGYIVLGLLALGVVAFFSMETGIRAHSS